LKACFGVKRFCISPFFKNQQVNIRKGYNHTNILAFFNKRDLLDAVEDDGLTWLDVVGRLKSGQYFYGQRRMSIMELGRWSKRR
jgi:hypothetical protein